MPACFHSVLKPFPPFSQFDFYRNPNVTTSISILQNYSNNYKSVKCYHRLNRSIKVLEHGTGVLLPTDDDTEVSVDSLIPDSVEEDPGIAPANIPTKRFSRKKVVDDVDDGDDNRFKLRNGKEVFFF